MPIFIETLKNDREDSDSVCYTLEALYSVMNDKDSEEDSHELINVPTDLGAQFTEIFIKQPENIQLVMEFVDAYEHHLRRNALRLLTVLLVNQPKDTQNVILQCPRAISKLVDLLSDPREALRNDALLLLLELTKCHTTIQKIVAFENIFERILAIVQSEGMTDGGVIVEDCLRLICQLLEANPPNQILFKENNFINRLLLILLDLHLNDTSVQLKWSAQKVVNVQLAMQALLLLLELTKCHTTIQKIVAFENIFERILAIVQSEGMTDGGVIVEDCLRLICQLLEANPPNQILFKENNFINRLLLILLDLHLNDTSVQLKWSAQKVVNVQLAMQILRILVSPRNKNQITRICQSVIHDCGLLATLCGIIMANGVPADVLTKAIYAIADVIRGCPANQQFLAHVIAPSDPPQPAITVLLVSMVNDRQALAVRAAALYCFQCYVAGNPDIQSSVIMTLLPKSVEHNASITDGQLLCGGLFSNDVLSSWFSSVALLHCIRDNPQLKEELLRVMLASNPDGTPISLLQQCFQWLIQSNKSQSRIGILQLLCTWLAYCPAAVRRFLSPSSDDQKNRVKQHSTATDGTSAARGTNLSALIAEAASSGNEESEIAVRGMITLLTCICVLFNPDDVPGFDR
ncbi:hypothetical protein FGIG_04659 [Fasciola gigantica]|uniref:Vesicle tethering protein Uso1/P115-like head domain-containing protein n=1 Tax=Fasciola gigantica TaxID=46835 RepID=A0A504YIA7_FASGI|nr:hypothetical protein FGIG_04659 [Fasciola gigantica]